MRADSKEILVVDDEAHVVRVLRMALERAGYSVRQATNGEEAFASIVRHAPNLMITDIDMPRMSGRQLCQRIAQELPGRRFGIVVLTSRAEAEHRQWSGDIVNLRFMEKPVSVRQLLVDLEQHFELAVGGEQAWTAAR